MLNLCVYSSTKFAVSLIPCLCTKTPSFFTLHMNKCVLVILADLSLSLFSTTALYSVYKLDLINLTICFIVYCGTQLLYSYCSAVLSTAILFGLCFVPSPDRHVKLIRYVFKLLNWYLFLLLLQVWLKYAVFICGLFTCWGHLRLRFIFRSTHHLIYVHKHLYLGQF